MSSGISLSAKMGLGGGGIPRVSWTIWSRGSSVSVSEDSMPTAARVFVIAEAEVSNSTNGNLYRTNK